MPLLYRLSWNMGTVSEVILIFIEYLVGGQYKLQ